MNYTELILGLTASILGCSTLMGFILYKGANRRIKDAEAAKNEVEVAMNTVEVEKNILALQERMRDGIREEFVERLGELKASLEESNKRYHDALVSGAKKDDIIEDKTQKIRELNEVIYTLQQKIMKLEKDIARLESYIEWLKLWHCSRETPTPEMTEKERCEGCNRRRPQQLLPLRYVPHVMQKEDSND